MALPGSPATSIVADLERRGSTVDCEHTGAGPAPGVDVRKGCMAAGKFVTLPCAEHMADSLHHYGKECVLSRFLDPVVAEDHRAGMRFPFVSR